MRVLITGSEGFVGKNLQLHLSERQDITFTCFHRNSDADQLSELVSQADFVVHLAGVNRPEHEQEFVTGNRDLTQLLCRAIVESGRPIPVIYTSSIQAAANNPYGQSKRAAEELLFEMSANHGVPAHVFRLPNVFGKWCKPNYNSVVATFCYNIAHDLPIQINDPSSSVTLVYVDDVVKRFVELIDSAMPALDADGFEMVGPQYQTTVGELAQIIRNFKASRSSLVTERVGTGFVRALYSTYMSYLSPEQFTYTVPSYVDPRGVFIEMVKTPDCGQFSCLMVHPGVTRGGHYHHSKIEKFLVIKGRARFKFRHMHTGEAYELVTDGKVPQIVETIPGWTHDITNIGDDDMVVMLWANEVFDRANPDTFACPL